jgi:DNA-binding NtrC family response regulator
VGRKISFTPDAEKAFYQHTFPGNFRELRRTIDSLFASQQNIIRINDLPKRFFKNETSNSTDLRANEKQHIEKIYKESNYIMAETARKLLFSNPHILREKMKKLGIELIKNKK